MTDNRMALAELLEKGSDSDLLHEMIGHVAPRLMQMGVKELVSAAHGERGEGRENWRNGYRGAALATSTSHRPSAADEFEIGTGPGALDRGPEARTPSGTPDWRRAPRMPRPSFRR